MSVIKQSRAICHLKSHQIKNSVFFMKHILRRKLPVFSHALEYN